MAGAVHCAARRAHMPAPSEIGSDLRYIDKAAGSHAHLILQHACFIHEYGAFHALDTAKLAYNALSDKKGEDIKIIDIQSVSVLADYFIIAHGSNPNQVQAMADNVDETLSKAGINPRQVEGYQTANWILMDYGDVIVHVFDEENRLFYDLERIWRDGRRIDPSEL